MGKVTSADTLLIRDCVIVPSMDTKKRRREPVPKPSKVPKRSFYLKEWRKFMGTKAKDLAAALDIERESYYRLERTWWTISTGEQEILATTIGIKPSQLWFPPPAAGQERLTPDELIENIPEELRPAAFKALRGMAGK